MSTKKGANTLAEEINEILKNGRYLKPPEWTNEIDRDAEIQTVDQDGEIRKVVCKKHKIEKVRKRNDMIPNMVSAQRRWELENEWYWECPQCTEDAHKKFMSNYNVGKEVRVNGH